MTDTGKAKANTVSTEEIQAAQDELSRIQNPPGYTITTGPPYFYTGPFIPPESFVIPSNHTADDLLKRAMSQR